MIRLAKSLKQWVLIVAFGSGLAGGAPVWAGLGVVLDDTFDDTSLKTTLWQDISDPPGYLASQNGSLELHGVWDGSNHHVAGIVSRESLWAKPQTDEMLRLTCTRFSTDGIDSAYIYFGFWNGKGGETGQGIWMDIRTGAPNYGRPTFYIEDQNTGRYDSYLMWDAYTLDGYWIMEWRPGRVKVYRYDELMFDSDIHGGEVNATAPGQWPIPTIPLGVFAIHSRDTEPGAPSIGRMRLAWAPECGEDGFLQADLDEDCHVSLLDLKILAEQWLDKFPPGPESDYFESRGYKLMRGRPLVITGLSAGSTMYDYDIPRALNMGLNVFFHYTDMERPYTNAIDANMPWIFWRGHTGVDRHDVDKYDKWPGLFVFYVLDEPELPEQNPPMWTKAIETTQYIKDNHPDKLAVVNIGARPHNAQDIAALEDYLDDVIDLMKPDILSLDNYPLIDGDHTEEYEYWNALKAVRDKSLAAGIPYWNWLWSHSEFHQGRRAPSESDLRYTVFRPLAFGYTGIQYLAYDTIGPPGIPDGIIARSTGEPSYLYSLAQELNSEIASLGPILTHSISTAVYHAGPDNPSPSTAENFTSYGHMIGFDPHESNWTLGFFEDRRGEEYFMVVNNEHHQDATAAQCTKSCVLTFAPSITTLLKIDRLTGAAVVVNLAADQTLNLTLPGGTGDLFKYDRQLPLIDYHCGDYGYDTGDLGHNCIGDLVDLSMIAAVWLNCTHADPVYCHDFFDCAAAPAPCKWLEENWRLNNHKD